MIRRAFLLTIALLLVAAHAHTQGEYNPAVLLKITSPADGAIVEPGKPLSVTVESGTVREAEFMVISPLGMSGMVSTVPGRAIIDVKTDAKAGRHPLTAIGNTRSRQPIVSESIEVDVERADPPTALVEINHLRFVEFTELGASMPMLLVATFADGANLWVSDSSHMAYSSSNPGVATVDRHGYIWPAGIGEATIRAEYRNGDERRAVEVEVQVPSFQLTVTPDSLDFGTQPIGVTSAPRTLMLKNTDTEPMRITAVHALGEYAASGCVGAAALPVGGTCALPVTFTPAQAGARDSMIGIETDRTILPTPIRVTGIGAPR
jgi:HYDIN/CFA65/VesB family protein